MRLFPSIPAAAAAGGVVSPLCMYASRVIEQRSGSDWLQFAVGTAGFLITIIAIGDFSSLREDWRRGGLFSWRSLARAASERTFERVVLPAWKRVAVWFAAVVASTLLLNLLRVAL